MSDLPPSSKLYSKFTLSLYDIWVHKLSAKLAWKVDVGKIHKLYAKHLNKESHLDIGVGTGFFILPQAKNANIDIADVNQDALELVQRKLKAAGASVDTIELDLYKTINLSRQYKSIGLSYVLHCLTGDKRQILNNIAEQLEEGGTFFGATLLNDNNCNMLARILMGIYNKSGVFCNINDTENAMKSDILQAFPHATFERSGQVLFFVSNK